MAAVLAASLLAACAAPSASRPVSPGSLRTETTDAGLRENRGAVPDGASAGAAFAAPLPLLPSLPPLPPSPAGPPAAPPLVADEVPTASCSLGVVMASGPPRAKPRKTGRDAHEARPFHAAPRIMVDVAGAADAPALADVQRTARAKGYWPVRRCYESSLRRDQHVRGDVAVLLSVDATGAVTEEAAAPPKGPPLGDPVAAACIRRELALLSFAERPEPVQAKVDVTLGTGDVPVFAAAPIANADAVREALRQSWPDATQCFVRALEGNPRAGGRLDLHVRVAPDGRVTSVQEGEAHLASPELAACVLDVYRRASLAPASHAAADTTLVYGLEFEPGDAP